MFTRAQEELQERLQNRDMSEGEGPKSVLRQLALDLERPRLKNFEKAKECQPILQPILKGLILSWDVRLDARACLRTCNL